MVGISQDGQVKFSRRERAAIERTALVLSQLAEYVDEGAWVLGSQASLIRSLVQPDMREYVAKLSEFLLPQRTEGTEDTS
jgi:hypothetical protein